jgi:hypothetical protein
MAVRRGAPRAATRRIGQPADTLARPRQRGRRRGRTGRRADAATLPWSHRQLDVPGLERGIERRGGVAAAAGQPGCAGDPLLVTGGERARRAAAGGGAGAGREGRPDGTAGRGDGAQDEVRLERPGIVALDVERVALAARRREAEAVGEGQRHHHRVEGMEPVGTATDHRQRQVELGGRGRQGRGDRRRFTMVACLVVRRVGDRRVVG